MSHVISSRALSSLHDVIYFDRYMYYRIVRLGEKLAVSERDLQKLLGKGADGEPKG